MYRKKTKRDKQQVAQLGLKHPLTNAQSLKRLEMCVSHSKYISEDINGEQEDIQQQTEDRAPDNRNELRNKSTNTQENMICKKKLIYLFVQQLLEKKKDGQQMMAKIQHEFKERMQRATFQTAINKKADKKYLFNSQPKRPRKFNNSFTLLHQPITKFTKIYSQIYKQGEVGCCPLSIQVIHRQIPAW